MLLFLAPLALAGTPVALSLGQGPLPEPEMRVVHADGEPAPPPYETEGHSSPDLDLVYLDDYEILAPLTFDSGWQPAGGIIQVAIRVNAEGGAIVEMPGTSHLSWPEAVTHSQTSWEDAGLFLLDATLDADFDLQFDILGVVWSDTLASVNATFFGEQVFTPFLLAGGEPEIVEVDASGDTSTLIDLEFDVFTGVALTFRTDMRTEIFASLAGIRKTVASDTETLLIGTAGETLLFQPPSAGSLELTSTYTGLYDAVLDLVFTPVVGICIDLLGCYDLAAFDIPIPLTEVTEERDFEPIQLVHDVPVMDVDTTGFDFGEVDIGDIATFELPIYNAGALDVYGTAGFVGTGDFTLFPADIRAGQNQIDGLVVTFAPTFEGEQQVVLILETNDPYLANLEIPLTGTGVEPEVGGVTVVSTENNCGCSATPRPSELGWVLVALGGVLLRRRKS
jgi:MYXO-CTERM domain-containing protein